MNSLKLSITNKIVEALENNEIPWHRAGIMEMPSNFTSAIDIIGFALSTKNKPCNSQKLNYDMAHSVLHKVPAKVVYNKNAEAYYEFPPSDFITLPCLEDFEEGIGGPEAYYETLAHELVHWTEPRLGFDYDGHRKSEFVRELRAELGAAFLMMELKVQNSVMYRNFAQYRKKWIKMIKSNPSSIFNIAESAVDAVQCILAYSGLKGHYKGINYVFSDKSESK